MKNHKKNHICLWDRPDSGWGLVDHSHDNTIQWLNYVFETKIAIKQKNRASTRSPPHSKRLCLISEVGGGAGDFLDIKNVFKMSSECVSGWAVPQAGVIKV